MSDFFKSVNDRVAHENNERLARLKIVRHSGQPLFQHYLDAERIITKEASNLQFYRKKGRDEFSWFERLFYGESRRVRGRHQLQEVGNFEQMVLNEYGELHLTLASTGCYGHHILTVSSTGPTTVPRWCL